MKIKPLIILMMLSGLGCSSIQVKGSEEKTILKLTTLWNDEFKNRQIENLVALYAEDAQIATAGAKLKNRDDCKRLFVSLFTNRKDIIWVNTPQKFSINYDWEAALEEGDWLESWTEPDGKATISGKYSTMWKKKNGLWLIHAMMFAPFSCTGESKYCAPHQK